jgi:predicted RNA methylase
MEGEMFVEQVRNALSPYQEFEEIDVDKAELAMSNIKRLKTEIDLIEKDIKSLERKLN